MSERQWTSAQQRAIEARTRTLVTAAAGSGKTSVLTELVAQVLVARELAPSQICAVTFTEKAAQEMRGRIAARLDALGEPDLVAELELARIGTIHSLCASILRMHGAAVGVDPLVGQLDDAQSAWILRSAYRTAIEPRTDSAQADAELDVHWLRARMGDDRIERTLGSLHRWAMQGDGTAQLPSEHDAAAILDPKTSEALVTADDARRALRSIDVLWQRFSAAIATAKHTLGRISFDDLERLAVEAIRIDDVRTALRARWGLVLVDEFQDTNLRQYELLDAIGGDRLFMVGDEWQSIYRFRGADVDVFRARRDDPAGGAVVPMRENFRSDAPVLDVVNRIFGHERLFGERYEPVNVGDVERQRGAAPAAELLIVPSKDSDTHTPADGLSARERQALRVAERIAQLVESGEADPGDIAVLYARNTGVDLYERALQAWGLPVLRGVSDGYYDQRDVRDVLTILACVRNGADDFATLGVLGGPLAALEWGELAQLRSDATAAGHTLLQQAADAGAPGRAQHAAGVIHDIRSLEQQASLVQLIAHVVALPELEIGAAQQTDGLERVANLRRLVELAASAEQVGVRDVTGFLEFVAAQRRDARVGEASIADEQSGAILLMTVHASKGLEFPHVFVIEAESRGAGRAGAVPDPLLDANGTVHVALPRLDGACERTTPLAQLADAETHAQAEERLRLWYVALTRAKHRVYVTASYDFTPRNGGAPRAVPGALTWLQEVLELGDFLGGAATSRTVADGLVHVDTHPVRQQPRIIWRDEQPEVALARPLPLPTVPQDTESTDESTPSQHALQAALRESVSSARSDEWRQLDGTRVHDAVARLLDAARSGTPIDALLDPERGPWLTDAVRARLEPVVASAVFTELVAHGARAEVPYVARRGATVESRAVPGAAVTASAAQVDAGRIDALALLDDGTWWVVDWKTTLPTEPADAWDAHGEQLRRYAATAIGAGAPGAIVTLVPLDRPHEPHAWHLDAASLDSGSSSPRPASVPAAT